MVGSRPTESRRQGPALLCGSCRPHGPDPWAVGTEAGGGEMEGRRGRRGPETPCWLDFLVMCCFSKSFPS